MRQNTNDLTPVGIALDAIRLAQRDLTFLGGCTHTDRPDLPLAPDTSWTTDVSDTLVALDTAIAALRTLRTRAGCCGCSSSQPSAPRTSRATLPPGR